MSCFERPAHSRNNNFYGFSPKQADATQYCKALLTKLPFTAFGVQHKPHRPMRAPVAAKKNTHDDCSSALYLWTFTQFTLKWQWEMHLVCTTGSNRKVGLSSLFVFALFYSSASNDHNRSSENCGTFIKTCTDFFLFHITGCTQFNVKMPLNEGKVNWEIKTDKCIFNETLTLICLFMECHLCH